MSNHPTTASPDSAADHHPHDPLGTSGAGLGAGSVPAPSFAQRFIAKNGRWLCPKCDGTVRSFDLPHTCKPWRAR